jgi:hypothetical protein
MIALGSTGMQGKEVDAKEVKVNRQWSIVEWLGLTIDQ